MLICCNRHFRGGYYRVLSNRQDFYRRIEYGICPCCGVYRFLDFRIVMGKERRKFLSGKDAELAFEKVIRSLRVEKCGTKTNQNFYFGDYKVTKKKDVNGNPVYLQLRRNFNDEAEILGEVNTVVYKLSNG